MCCAKCLICTPSLRPSPTVCVCPLRPAQIAVAALMSPYVGWLAFATALNAKILKDNPDVSDGAWGGNVVGRHCGLVYPCPHLRP